MTTLKQRVDHLNALIKKRDAAIARNNAEAAVNPGFAAKLAAARADDLDVRADAAVAEVNGLLLQNQAMGGLTLALVGSVGVLAVVAAASLVYWQLAREERQFAEANPMQAALQSATSLAGWVVVGGIAVLGGLIYLDYRKGHPEVARRPFDEGRKQEERSAKQFAEDVKTFKRELAQMQTEVSKPGKTRGKTRKDATKTKVDEALAQRMAEELAIQQAIERAERGEQARRWQR